MTTCCGQPVVEVLGPKVPVVTLPNPPRQREPLVQFVRWQCRQTEKHHGVTRRPVLS